MLQGKPEDGLKYANQVLEEDPLDTHGVCVKANLLTALKKYNDAINLFRDKEKIIFNKKLLENAQCAYVLGFVYYQKEDYRNARKLFKKATQIDSSVPDYFALLGLSISVPVLSKNSLPWLIYDEAKKEIEEAEDYLSQALELLKDSETNRKKGNILVNRSAIRAALGNLEGSVDDLIN